MSQTPYSNDNDNSAPGATALAAHPQSHSVKLMSIRSLTFSSSQESMKGGDLLCKGRKRKATTQAIQISPSGQQEIENTQLNELPSPDHACQYVKDKLMGKITCMVCGEEGHYTCDCSMKDQEEKLICTLCNRVGHCHLWCCRGNVLENCACRRCGEKGHYTKKTLSCGEGCSHNRNISCSSCDTNHPLGNCPMGNITCFLCEGKDHVPAQCHLRPMLTAVTQYHRESFHAALKKAMAETSRRTFTPVKPSRECPHDEEITTVSNFSINGQDHSERKNTIGSEVLDSDKTSHAAMTDKSPTLVSKFTCFNCHEEGHCANGCLRKKPSRGLELHDVSCRKKKLPIELELCDVTCFICHDKGHKSYSCPKNNPPRELEHCDFTCFICHDKGHRSYSCPKKPPGELELSDVTCLKCNAKGHYTYCCLKKKRPGELEPYDDSHECQFKGGSETVPERLSHGEEDHCDRKSAIRSQAPYSDKANHAAMSDKSVTLISKFNCFKCGEEGHYAYKCPRKNPSEELELHDATHLNFHANSCPKKKPRGELELSDVTCFQCHDKGHKSYSCPKKKPPGELELADVICFKCHDKGHKSYNCPKKSPGELDPSNAICFRCHNKGHYMYSCPKKLPR